MVPGGDELWTNPAEQDSPFGVAPVSNRWNGCGTGFQPVR